MCTFGESDKDGECKDEDQFLGSSCGDDCRRRAANSIADPLGHREASFHCVQESDEEW